MHTGKCHFRWLTLDNNYKQLETWVGSGQQQESFHSDKSYKVLLAVLLLAVLIKQEVELSHRKAILPLLEMKHK